MINKRLSEYYFKSKYFVNCCTFFSTQPSKSYKHLDKILKYIEVIQLRYEDVMGMTTIKKIQDDVIEVEKALNLAQLQRQKFQNELDKLRTKLKNISLEMERTPRGHDSYLKLITEEHSLLKLETPLKNEFNIAVENERVTFEELSKRVRHAHEKERERVEKTRFLSLFFTVIGAGVGIIGSIISDVIKNRRLRNMYGEAKELLPLINQISEKVDKFYNNYNGNKDEIKKFEKKILSLIDLNNQLSDKIDFLINEPAKNKEFSKENAEKFNMNVQLENYDQDKSIYSYEKFFEALNLNSSAILTIVGLSILIYFYSGR